MTSNFTLLSGPTPAPPGSAGGDGSSPNNDPMGAMFGESRLTESGFTGEITWDTSMPNGQPRRNLDASRATELFGFRATTSLRAGLERTIAWYRENALTRA